MRGPLCYIGGKNRLAQHIISLLPKHTTYVEPFAGGAQLLFRKEPSEVEVVNDLDNDIVNFFRICQNHHEELLRYLKYVLVSRKWFEVWAEMSPEGLTDIQRAARFFYLQKNAFAGRVFRRNFAPHVIQPTKFTPEGIIASIENAHARLARVQIESLPYQDILEKYDRPTTAFYLDPPYYGKQLYRFNFKEEDFGVLSDRLRKLKGKFLLSLNDVPPVRTLFRGFNIEPVQLSYSAQKHAGRKYNELIIKNFS
jgi:DNA adenine methylase